MGADTMISYIMGSLAAMGVLAFFVAVIVQTVKELPVLKKLPTSAGALGVSLILPCWHSALMQEKALPGILSALPFWLHFLFILWQPEAGRDCVTYGRGQSTKIGRAEGSPFLIP